MIKYDPWPIAGDCSYILIYLINRSRVTESMTWVNPVTHLRVTSEKADVPELRSPGSVDQGGAGV